MTNLEASFAAFRRLLPALAAADADLHGATPDETVLLRVARQAGKQPERLDELIRFYGRPGPYSARTRIQSPPRLERQHLTEDYRPAWEALLLASPSGAIDFMQGRFSITDALSKIGNPESLSVLGLAFSATCEAGVDATENSAAVQRQLRIMQALNRFATAESLQTTLRCLDRAEAASGGKMPKYSGDDLRGWVVRFLKDQDNYYGPREKWRAVLSSFPKDGLPASQRELLERATREQ
jgi:hypothetical protein